MIVGSLLIIAVAVTLLVMGLAAGSSTLLIGSIAASLLAAVALVVGARQASGARGTASGPSSRGPSSRGPATAPGQSGAAVPEPGWDTLTGDDTRRVPPDMSAAETVVGRPGDRVQTLDTEVFDRPLLDDALLRDTPDVADGDDPYAEFHRAQSAAAQGSPDTRHDVTPDDYPAPEYAASEHIAPERVAYAQVGDEVSGDHDHVGLGGERPGPDDQPVAPAEAAAGYSAAPVTPAPADEHPLEAHLQASPPPAGHPQAGHPQVGQTQVGQSNLGEPVEHGDEDPADEPPPQRTQPADAVRVSRMIAEVLVVDGRPRYHLADCASLGGRITEALPVAEAVELGFTPCSRCRPVDRLVAEAVPR